jgi:hypothetical protein
MMSHARGERQESPQFQSGSQQHLRGREDL